MKCEKQQAAAIADYLRKVMSDLPSPADQPLPAAMELAEPVDPAFVLGPIGLGYDRDNDRVLVQLEEVVDRRRRRRRDRSRSRRGSRPPSACCSSPEVRRAALCESHRGDRRRRPAPVPVVRQPDRPRRPSMPADELTELTRSSDSHILTCGELDVEGRMPWSSNATFLVNVARGDVAGTGIYKPMRGERPLWDFEPGCTAARSPRISLSEATGLRTSCRRRSARRTLRRGIGAVVRRCRPSPALLHDLRGATRPPRPRCGRSPCSTSSPTTPTARAATACSTATTHLGHRSRPVLLRRFKLRTVIWEFGGEPIDPGELRRRRAADRRPGPAGDRRRCSPTTRSRRCRSAPSGSPRTGGRSRSINRAAATRGRSSERRRRAVKSSSTAPTSTAWCAWSTPVRRCATGPGCSSCATAVALHRQPAGSSGRPRRSPSIGSRCWAPPSGRPASSTRTAAGSRSAR